MTVDPPEPTGRRVGAEDDVVDGAEDDVVDAEIVESPHPEPVLPVLGMPAAPSVPADPITDYTDAGIPTLAYLQDKVERRYATALGSHELAEATIPEVADAAKRREELAKSAQERLNEIRRSLHPDTPTPPTTEAPEG